MVGEGCDNRREEGGGGQSRKRGKWKMHFFFPLSLVHMRAQLCLRVSHFQFALSNGNKTSECECVKYVCCVSVCVLSI